MTKEQAPQFNAASQYHDYANKYDVYINGISRLVKIAWPYLKNPAVIYDLACGTGISLRYLAETFPEAKIIGFDKSTDMLAIAKNKLASNHNILFQNGLIEEISPLEDKSDAIFCNAAFWYFDTEKVLPVIRNLMSENGVFAFNISEPAINFKDGAYDDRFLQTMVEVLDDKGIIFHRDDGIKTGRLKLSYEPPTISDIENNLEKHEFKLLTSNVWRFTKTLPELADFYMMPGFGTKAFRELTDEDLKKEIINEIVRRLSGQGIKETNFRWAEFCCSKI